MIFTSPSVGAEEQAALDRIEEMRGELRYYVAEPRRWVGPVRRVLAARAIQGSNSIEGFNVSVEDAVAALEGDEPQDSKNEDFRAVSSYRRALTYVIQLSRDDHFSYSSSLLRSLHFMMTEYDLDASPGLWRPRGIWIRNEASGDIVYEGPDHELVPGLVEELVEDLQADSDAPVMVRAAMSHLNLVMIHPFRDGNGRMSRCLQTLVLAREGILVPEFSSIEEYLGRNTASYYEILRDVGQGRWNPQNDARPWIRYCLTAHYIQAASVVRRVRESERLWQELEALVSRRSLPERSIEALFDAAIGLRVRNASYRSSLKSNGVEISNQTATNDLRALVDAAVLVKKGQKRGTFYVASDELATIYQRVRSTRTPIDASQLFDPPQPQLFPSD